MSRVFISDCEGPICKNDNAFEVASHFVPNGDKFFTVVSRYDDVLAEVLKKPGYRAGYTLKLILPFLRAYNVTDLKMQRFSARSLILIPNIRDTLSYVRNIAHAYIVSTSYEHYVKALCQALNFPYENVYCTKVSIDKYNVIEEERKKLKELAREISQMPVIEIPPKARSLDGFPEAYRITVKRLDQIFRTEMANMNCVKIFCAVSPVGGGEKAKAVKEAAERVGMDLSSVMYVGDSITDMEAFKVVRKNDGLAVSFNGNQYAIENAEMAILSESSTVVAVIADVFCRFGKRRTLRLVENWNREALRRSQVSRSLLDNLFELYPRELPKVKIITSENTEILAKESSEFRKKVRGEAVGRLG